MRVLEGSEAREGSAQGRREAFPGSRARVCVLLAAFYRHPHIFVVPITATAIMFSASSAGVVVEDESEEQCIGSLAAWTRNDAARRAANGEKKPGS